MMSLLPGSMRKYLIFLSYVGSEFRGMQKQSTNLVNGKLVAVQTVQECIEKALQRSFRLFHDVHVFTSSRTDTGVHAIRTSVHVRLQREKDIPQDDVTMALNKYFTRGNIGIRIQSTHMVPETFCSRKNALSRTYLYRLAIRKKSPEINPTPTKKHLEMLPISEHNRTFFILDSRIDVEKMKEAAALIPGTKDFLCFMGKPSAQPHDKDTVRTIYSLSITPGSPFMPEQDPFANNFEYWNITCSGRGFLYRQIRRTVGLLIAVGKGMLTLDDVRLLFDKPVPESWNTRAVCVPPWGLYLLDVSYSPLHYQPVSWSESENVSCATYAALY